MEADSLEQAVEAVEALINDGELPEDLEWTDAEDEIDHPTIDNGF